MASPFPPNSAKFRVVPLRGEVELDFFMISQIASHMNGKAPETLAIYSSRPSVVKEMLQEHPAVKGEDVNYNYWNLNGSIHQFTIGETTSACQLSSANKLVVDLTFTTPSNFPLWEKMVSTLCRINPEASVTVVIEEKFE